MKSSKSKTEEKRYKILNATSNCPHNECDGNGMSLILDTETGQTFAKACKCREELLQANRLKFADIPEEFKNLSINSFQTDVYSNNNQQSAIQAKKAAANFVKNYKMFEEKGKGLYFYSYTKGSGKTRLAVSIGNALLKVEKVTVKFIQTIDLLNEIKATFDKDTKYTQSQLIDAIRNVRCLILDDIGVERQGDWVNEIFYSILDHRMTQKKVTIFTSNSKVEELKHDERIKSRITKMVYPVYLPDEDVRKKIASKENADYFTGILYK